MPPLMSKPKYSTPSGYTVGGTKDGDYHIWVEDMNGKVVFDPTFPEHEFIQMVHNLDKNCPVYYEWPNQKKWFKNFKQLEVIKAMRDTGFGMCDFYDAPVYLCCPQNCTAFMHHNRNKRYRMVIGSMGWRKQHQEAAWWEWG